MWVAAVSLMAVIAIAAVFFYVQQTAGHTTPAWVTTRPVTAGELLSDVNVQLAPVGTAGVPINSFRGDPRRHLAAHELEARDVLRKADVLSDLISQVPLTLKYAPNNLHDGDTVDVYAAVVSGGGNPTPATARLVLVGKRVVVASSSSDSGGQITLNVPASDEARWVALQSGNVLLFAARSRGIGIEPPPVSGLTVSEALGGLSGGSVSGSVLLNPTASATPTQAGNPTASPAVKPKP
jgi:hypothetical protein